MTKDNFKLKPEERDRVPAGGGTDTPEERDGAPEAFDIKKRTSEDGWASGYNACLNDTGAKALWEALNEIVLLTDRDHVAWKRAKSILEKSRHG